jgi:hypothetical protein
MQKDDLLLPLDLVVHDNQHWEVDDVIGMFSSTPSLWPYHHNLQNNPQINNYRPYRHIIKQLARIDFSISEHTNEGEMRWTCRSPMEKRHRRAGLFAAGQCPDGEISRQWRTKGKDRVLQLGLLGIVALLPMTRRSGSCSTGLQSYCRGTSQWAAGLTS